MRTNSVVITGIICVTILETVALLKGINGTILTLVIGSIGLAAGWRIPNGR